MAPNIDIVIKGHDQISKVVTGIGGKIQGMSKQMRMAGMAMTAAGAAIVGSLAMCVTSFAKTGDEIQKMADRTGISTEALSELKYAAELGGASLDDVEKSVRRMQRGIVEAADGVETYTDIFDKLGVSIEEVQAMTPEAQFETLSRAIADLEDPTLRAAMAQELFGRSGTALLPMLASGAEGLDALRKKAHDLGIVFDQEAADSAANFNDALTTLKGSFEGIKMMVAEHIVPVLTDLVDKVTPVITRIKAWIEENPKLFKTILMIVGALGGILMVLGPLLMILPSLVGGLGILGAAFGVLMGPVGLIIAAIAALIAIGVLVWKNWDTIRDKAKEIWGNIVSFFKGVWEKITDIFKAHWDKVLAILFPAVGIPILIARNWDKIVDFFKGLWAKVKEIFIKIGLAIYEPIADAVNWVIEKINTLIQFINKIPFINIGEIGFRMPELPGTAPSPVQGPINPQGGLEYLGRGAIPFPMQAPAPVNVYLDGELVTERMLEREADAARLQGWH